MGGLNSKISELSFPLGDFETVWRRYDPVLGSDIHLIKHRQNPKDLRLMKESPILDAGSLASEFESLESLIELNNKSPSFLRVYGFSHSKESGLCGRIQKLYLIFENYENSMRQELAEGFPGRRAFYSENELWRVVESVALGLKHLQDNGLPHSCLRLSLIFRTNVGFKLLLPKLFNLLPNFANYLRLLSKEDFFLAPEEIQKINENSFVNSNQYKADVFVLGCLILELTQKLRPSDLITQDAKLLGKGARRAVESLSKDFSEGFIGLLREMLDESPEKRPIFSQILDRITLMKGHLRTGFSPNEKNSIRLTKVLSTHIAQQLSLKERTLIDKLRLYFLCLYVVPNTTDETLKKFDETKKAVISRLGKAESLKELKQYPSPLLPLAPKYDLVEEVFPDGSVYKGEKLAEKRHGKGVFIYSDGGVYEGDWRNGQMDGYGVLYYADRSIAYEGEWKRDKFDGRGILHNEPASIDYEEGKHDLRDLGSLGNFWLKYEGGFREDKKDGSGVFYLPNGDRISGSWRADKLEGVAVWYRKVGDAIKAEWKVNRLLKIL